MRKSEAGSAGEFSGMLAVVTGAAQGIGRAIAELFHDRGARLLLLDRNAAGMEEAAAAMRATGRDDVDTAVLDLADPLAIAAIAGELAGRGAWVDVLVNNAGIEVDTEFLQVTAEEFDRVISVNLRAPMLLSQALAPLFPASGGAIVNISSIHASHAFPNSIPYACSKAGLVALTRNLALELAPRKIRVNAVCPGYIDTPMWDEWLRLAADSAALAAQTEALHPLGRRGAPDDVASAVMFLASRDAAWITGTHMVVDGGLTIRAHP